MTQPEEKGRWEPVQHRFNHLPIHTALLHTGKVLAFGGSGNDETQIDDPYPAEIFDPEEGEVREVGQELAGDLFCAGHSFLPDGRLLVAGGTHRYDKTSIMGFEIPIPPFTGLDQAYLFDPETERWTRVGDMDAGRWYPTLLTLGDGRVLTAAGFMKRFPWVFLRKLEIYTPGEGWSTLEGAGRWLPLYPRFHLLPDGDVFYAGSYNTHYTFPFSLTGFPTALLDPDTGEWTRIGLPNQSQREEGACVLLPLRPGNDYNASVLLAGGGTPGGEEAVSDTEIISFDDPDPEWRRIEPMKHSRYHAYPVLLPTGDVFVMGGREGPAEHDHSGENEEISHDESAVLEPELFSPEKEEWITLAPMKVDRLYHSNALLLPDGRVLTMGSNPKRRVNELRIETYKPPYYFKERPRIDTVPETVIHSEKFEIGTRDASSVDEVCMVRQSSTTHCLNTDQRHLELVIEDTTDDMVRVAMVENRSLAPPGYYLVFVLDDGTPSEGRFVHVPV